MVLFKRKPVHLLPDPTSVLDSDEVYVMKGTHEVFTDYEAYLKRFDYLTQKKFTDAVNGKSGLTYFDALESEAKSSIAIENIFPEVVKDPILRRVQFQTISRIDDLVNVVFDEFKRDFFPGEEVIAMLNDGEHHVGVIREKAKFPAIHNPDGSIQRNAFSRYFVRIEDSKGGEEALLDDVHIRRDKKVFTKQNLRAFLKNSLQREGWVGAPWLVKEHLAIQYRLPMEIPAHLMQEAKILATKQMLQSNSVKNAKRPKLAVDLPNATPTKALTPQQLAAPPTPKVEAPPPIKYPIEDLDTAPIQNGVSRPELKFFNDELTDYVRSNRKSAVKGIKMSSLGAFLECWNTLNVQCEVYFLDSFTFDDFVAAMTWTESYPDCELLDEVHCAVLKTLVDGEGNHQLQVKLPEVEEDDENDESDGDVSGDVTLQNVPAHSTRSKSLQNSMIEIVIPEPKIHIATEYIGERSWQERIKGREFEEGGWQVILIGILYQMSFSTILKYQCEQILAVLAPVDSEPTPAIALSNYRTMDPNLRISALQIISELSLTSKPLREFLETCASDMTATRKKKTEFQRQRRIAMEKLQVKDRERKVLLPANTPDSPKAAPVAEPEAREDTIMTNGATQSDAEEDVAPSARSLRRGQDRKRKREEEAARREKERAEKAEAAKALSHQTKEFRKLLQEIEALKEEILDLEEQITDCDVDLREANVQRTKLLGQDRFFNRYWWFERNGQPFGGLPTSSTAGNGYANGRIWVQGPDESEIEPYLDDEEFQREYRMQFRMTVAERRRHEEGPTILQNSREWGIIDDPERLDDLIGWLDERGIREKKLRKELLEWRALIVLYMNALKKYSENEATRRAEHDEEQRSRISTRHQTAVDFPAAQNPVLRWNNSMAVEEFGHIHSREPRRSRGKQKQKGVAVLVNRHVRSGRD